MKHADRVKLYRHLKPCRDGGRRVGEWRWTRTAPNGEIVAASTEGYWRKVDCLANARRVMTKCEIV